MSATSSTGPGTSPPGTASENPWVVVGLFSAPALTVELILVAAWLHGSAPAGVLIFSQWLLVPILVGTLLMEHPAGKYPGDYPRPDPAGDRGWWEARLPGLPFGFVFPVALIPVGILELVVLEWSAREWGGRLGAGGVLLVAALWLAAGAAVGLAVRTRPRIAVDPDRREVKWRPGNVRRGRLTLPFDAVVAVRAEANTRDHWRPVSEWRSNTGRVRTTRLPPPLSRGAAEAFAGRLREAVFGGRATPFA